MNWIFAPQPNSALDVARICPSRCSRFCVHFRVRSRPCLTALSKKNAFGHFQMRAYRGLSYSLRTWIYIYIYTALSYERFRRSTLPVTAAAVQQYCCCCCTTQPLYSRSTTLLLLYHTQPSTAAVPHSPRVYRQNHGNDMTTQMAYCLTHVGGST